MEMTANVSADEFDFVQIDRGLIDAHKAKVLTEDEARRIASNIAKLPEKLLVLANADRTLAQSRPCRGDHLFNSASPNNRRSRRNLPTKT
jgi:hypothetical protein